jgi:hypothetical protein
MKTGIHAQLTLDYQLREPSQEMLALILGHLIDALRMVAYGVYAFPASHRVRPDNWMDGGEVCADILRSTTLGTVKLVAVLLCALVEDRLCVGSCQPFQELLVSSRQTVIDLVTRRPQGIATGLGQLSQTQDGVVTWNGLEGDVAVPAFFAALFLVTSEALGVQRLGLFRADHGNLVVFTAESATAVGDWVNVQLGSGGLARKLAQALRELFLELVVQVVLFTEEDHSTLGDCLGLVTNRGCVR